VQTQYILLLKEFPAAEAASLREKLAPTTS